MEKLISSSAAVLTRQPLQAAGEFDCYYAYPNSAFAPVDVWVAQPPDCWVQDQVRVVARNSEPAETVTLGPATLDRYRVSSFEKLEIHWRFRRLAGSARGAPAFLPPLERALYLHPSPQMPRHADLDAEARRLSAGKNDPWDIAREIFLELVRGYRYVYPVGDRGAVEMLRSRRGDCGQFSILFTALCRSAGVPARVVMGTLLGPRTSAHSWVEFWTDEVGWAPADPAMANVLAGRGALSAPPVGRNPVPHFGRLEGAYFAFSIGVDLALGEFYGPPVRPMPLVPWLTPAPRYAGQRLNWGYETLGGCVPHFQPAYPRNFRGAGLNALLQPPAVGCWAATPGRVSRLAFNMSVRETAVLWAVALEALDLLFSLRLVPHAALLVHVTALLAMGLLVLRAIER